jgi:formyltetrahydrofolate-dependent phosphoribosylglycinamide formyltransferase
MFKRLQQKWKVGSLQIILIIICFAIGGSLTGFIAKKIMNLLSIQQDWLWAIIYILLVTIIWPLAVIIVSIFFGQLKFFSGYVRRLGEKLGIIRSSELRVQSHESVKLTTLDSRFTTNIAIFASGTGSNAKKIIDHFRDSSLVKIALVVCNKKEAGVVGIAKNENIPFILVEKEKFFQGNGYLDELKEKKIDFIVLAGFLWKIPDVLLKAYPKRIINIHPALLPNYGGKGMYGNYVHEAVITAKEKESGITIHYVDEHYDNGDIILQVKCPVLDNDSPESLAHRIHALEHANYPIIIEELARKLLVY